LGTHLAYYILQEAIHKIVLLTVSALLSNCYEAVGLKPDELIFTRTDVSSLEHEAA
jgi:hypothetical protein